jgi:hypothetical protein
MRTLRTLIIVTALLLPSSALADTGEMLRLEVTPIQHRGEWLGCQIKFVRRDHEYGRAPIQVRGSVRLINLNSTRHAPDTLTLELGLAPLAPSTAPYRALSSGYLVAGSETNATELVHQADSLAPGSREFTFSLGERTVRALIERTERGEFNIDYTMDGSSASARFILDLSAAEQRQDRSSFRPLGPRKATLEPHTLPPVGGFRDL